MSQSLPLTRWNVFAQSWPIMLANAGGALVGMVDTFVIGRYADTSALAGIGLGAVIYGIVYWGFGFLRMSTAGLAAQSDGAGDETAVQAHIFRAMPIGLAIGLTVFITQALLLAGAFAIFTADPGIENSAGEYIRARLWGLPATLATIALMGWFVGISRSQDALKLQIGLQGMNAALSLWFVAGLGLGLSGAGWASAIAEWFGLACGLTLMLLVMRKRGGLRREALSKDYLLRKDDLSRLGISNGNIFIRTMTLTVGFNFFGNAGASEGEVFLAGNHILMQFITLVALILDGFAHTAEAVTGSAFGAKNRARFDRAIRLTTEFSAIFGIFMGAAILFGGPYAIIFLTKDPDVIASAMTFLPYCAAVPILGFAAWQLDGIFIGTTQTRQMRDAGLMSVAAYIALHFALTPFMGQHGIWAAFLMYYVFRALAMGIFYPGVRQSLQPQTPS